MRHAVQHLQKFCRVLTVLLLIPALLFLFSAVPMLFGYVPLCMTNTEDVIYPSGALCFARYTPAEQLEAGNIVVVQAQERTLVCAISSIDPAERLICTEEGEFPVEQIEGKLTALRIPGLGYVLRFLCKPLCLVMLGVLMVFAVSGVFFLPKIVYAPRFGR